MPNGQEIDTARVTILTEYFHPEESATARLLTELAVSLQERDRFDVSAITARPNYHDHDRKRSVPLYEHHQGVSIRRLRSSRFDKDSLPLRVINWTTFTMLSTLRALFVQTDLLFVVSNPPTLPVAAWIRKRLRGTPYVYVVHDVYPDIAVAVGVLDQGLTVYLWNQLNNVLIRDADHVVVLGDSMRERVVQKVDGSSEFDSKRVEVIPNWEDDRIRPLPKSENEFARKKGTVEPFTLVYSGNVGRYHELKTAIRAIQRLERCGRSDIQLLIIGDGGKRERLRQYVNQEEIDGVRFLPFQPRERLPETLTCGDAWLVGVTVPACGTCVSSKLYAALASGCPVLAITASSDDVARTIQDGDCGVHVRPGDVETAADTLERWADNPELVADLGARARELLEQKYTREHAVEQYATVLSSVIERS